MKTDAQLNDATSHKMQGNIRLAGRPDAAVAVLDCCTGAVVSVELYRSEKRW